MVGAVPFQSFLSTVHVARENTAVHPFSTELPYTGYLFYISRFFRESGMRRKIVQGET